MNETFASSLWRIAYILNVVQCRAFIGGSQCRICCWMMSDYVFPSRVCDWGWFHDRVTWRCQFEVLVRGCWRWLVFFSLRFVYRLGRTQMRNRLAHKIRSRADRLPIGWTEMEGGHLKAYRWGWVWKFLRSRDRKRWGVDFIVAADRQAGRGINYASVSWLSAPISQIRYDWTQGVGYGKQKFAVVRKGEMGDINVDDVCQVKYGTFSQPTFWFGATIWKWTTETGESDLVSRHQTTDPVHLSGT